MYSCSLDEPSYGKTTSDNYYQKESDIEQALTGAYLQLRTTWNEYALNHYFVGDCSTDDALKGGGNDGDRAEVRDLSDFTIYTTNGEIGRRWEILYRLINRCNDVIYYAPDAIGNEELLKRYANEAKALRAFGYYCLVTTFGEVPLITTPMQPAEILQIPRSPLEKVYECIVNDLTDASALPAKEITLKMMLIVQHVALLKQCLLKHTCSKVILPLPKRYFMILLKWTKTIHC